MMVEILFRTSKLTLNLPEKLMVNGLSPKKTPTLNLTVRAALLRVPLYHPIPEQWRPLNLAASVNKRQQCYHCHYHLGYTTITPLECHTEFGACEGLGGVGLMLLVIHRSNITSYFPNVVVSSLILIK